MVCYSGDAHLTFIFVRHFFSRHITPVNTTPPHKCEQRILLLLSSYIFLKCYFIEFHYIPIYIYISMGIQYNRVPTSLTSQRLPTIYLHTLLEIRFKRLGSSARQQRQIFHGPTYTIYRTFEIIYIFIFQA